MKSADVYLRIVRGLYHTMAVDKAAGVRLGSFRGTEDHRRGGRFDLTFDDIYRSL